MDIPAKAQGSPYFIVLKSSSYKFLQEYLEQVPEGEKVYLFIWASYRLDDYLKIFEAYPGDMVVYRCSLRDGKDIPVSEAMLSRFNISLSKIKPDINLNYFASDPVETLFFEARRRWLAK